MKLTKKEISRLVDDLGHAKAQAADAADAENAIKAKLIAAGVTEAEGELFRATISESERETKDKPFKELVDRLIEEHTSPQYRAAHTSKSTVTSVRVVARVKAAAA